MVKLVLYECDVIFKLLLLSNLPFNFYALHSSNFKTAKVLEPLGGKLPDLVI